VRAITFNNARDGGERTKNGDNADGDRPTFHDLHNRPFGVDVGILVGIQSATSSAQREATDSRDRSGLLARGIDFCREQQRNDQAGAGQAIASGMVSVTLVSQNHENIHASKQSLVVRVAVLRPASPAPTP